jgi:hypothetical protein
VDEVRGEVPVRLLQPPVPRHAGFPCRGPGEGSVHTVYFLFFKVELGRVQRIRMSRKFLGFPDVDP